MASYVAKTPKDTAKIAKKLAATLKSGQVLAFYGQMGSGKTTFCCALAKALKCTDPAFSPTFAIANFYRGKMPLAHLDAFRISQMEELEDAGFYDYLDAGAVVAVEWSENIQNFLPEDCIKIAIDINCDNSRTINIEGANGI